MELIEKLSLAVRCQPKDHEDHYKKQLVLKALEKVSVEVGVSGKHV